MGDGARDPCLRQRQHRGVARGRTRPLRHEGDRPNYQAFRDGILEDDDEVAVLHGPEELGYPSVTEAMVNIRATLAAAEQSRVIAPSVAARLIRIAQAFFYKERTYPAILQAAAAQGLPQAALQALAAWLPSGKVDQKARDALAMLNAIRAHLAAVTPLQVSYVFAHTVAWEAACRRTHRELNGDPSAPRS